MSKKVSELQKKQIKDLFIQGNSIQEISKSFQFSQQTITRQLKIIFGEIDFKKLKKKISFSSQTKKTIGGTNFRKTDSFSEEENKKDIDTYSANESFSYNLSVRFLLYLMNCLKNKKIYHQCQFQKLNYQIWFI